MKLQGNMYAPTHTQDKYYAIIRIITSRKFRNQKFNANLIRFFIGNPLNQRRCITKYVKYILILQNFYPLRLKNRCS